MRKRAGRVGFVAVTMILVFVAAYFCAATVLSRSDFDAQEQECSYREKEQELTEQVREFLEGEGFDDSGVMLTRVLEGDGSRQYTLTVHHGRIDIMCETERQLLMERLEKIVFSDENSAFYHEFLINQ